MPKKLIALCLFRDQYAHIQGVEKALKEKVDLVYDEIWDQKILFELMPDIVIGINEYHLDMIKCYQTAKDLSIPTLTIQDGILEWRFMFENDLYKGNENGVPMHHPIIADKYACIGLLMANHIAQLGNRNKIEITGMPKMDNLILNKIKKTTLKAGKKRILIITSSKPWFDEEQKIILIESLKDIKSFFDSHPEFEVQWRITKGLEQEIGVQTSFNKKETSEIADQIINSDAIITTTSTTIIESMLSGKPVATLDYFNRPVLTPTVWNIRQRKDIEIAIRSMLSENQNLFWMQENIKNQLIRTDHSASETIASLVLKMIIFRKNNADKEFPSNMCEWDYFENQKFQHPKRNELYEQREVFKNADIEWLQSRILRSERENEAMRKQLNKRSFGFMVLSAYGKLKKIARKK